MSMWEAAGMARSLRRPLRGLSVFIWGPRFLALAHEATIGPPASRAGGPPHMRRKIVLRALAVRRHATQSPKLFLCWSGRYRSDFWDTLFRTGLTLSRPLRGCLLALRCFEFRRRAIARRIN